VLISKNTMGFGDDVLGSGLILNFLSTLNEMGETLWRLVFLNSGVKLTIARAETLPAPQQLEAQGVSILMYGLVSITSSYWSKSGLERPPICSTL
jgi:hypothetical protein